MFALKSMPPEQLKVAGFIYRISKVFKHDFWAATCLYELVDYSHDSLEYSIFAAHEPGETAHIKPACPASQIIVKFGRDHDFMGLPAQLIGQWLVNRELQAYRQLSGIAGIPKLIGRVNTYAFAIEFIKDAKPLDHFSEMPAEFFDKLRAIYDQLHRRGLAYVDANKRSNVLVTRQGNPVLIDFQISALAPTRPKPIDKIEKAVAKYFMQKDIYHLLKHKRRMCKTGLSDVDKSAFKSPSGLHKLHRKIIGPYKNLRRKFLATRLEKGYLKSPTQDFESHYQPEKNTWQAQVQNHKKEDVNENQSA